MRWIIYAPSFVWLKRFSASFDLDYSPGTYDPLDGRIEVWALPGASETEVVEAFERYGIEYIPVKPGKGGTTGP
jgi:hypothetical protein